MQVKLPLRLNKVHAAKGIAVFAASSKLKRFVAASSCVLLLLHNHFDYTDMISKKDKLEFGRFTQNVMSLVLLLDLRFVFFSIFRY